jgi:CheY-like chemotaxis protein
MEGMQYLRKWWIMAGRMKAVCFVDDNIGEIKRFKDNLKDHFIIGAGTSITEALSDLQKRGVRKPDLFILDLYFPEGPRNTEEELMRLDGAREALLEAETEFLSVLAQLKLSSHGGLELAKGLKERWGSTPFIFFTRKGTLEDSVRGLRQGALKVIKKPDPNKSERKGRTVSEAYDLAFENDAGKIAYEINDAIRLSTWWWKNRKIVAGFLLGLLSSIVAGAIFTFLA